MLIIGPLQDLADRDFPGGPVVKAPCTQGRGLGLIAGQGTKSPHATGHGQENNVMIDMRLE